MVTVCISFYVWLLVIAIILSSRNSIKLSYYLHSNIISVLATLILMSFTKLLRNITNVMMATSLDCPGDHNTLVWSMDGNVKYFNFKHSILMGFSMIILLGVLCYAFIILTAQWLQRYSGKVCKCISCNLMFKIQPFLDAYTGPYKNKYRFWTGILLILRIVITFIFMYTLGSVSYINNYIIILSQALIIMSTLGSKFHPFSH